MLLITRSRVKDLVTFFLFAQALADPFGLNYDVPFNSSSVSNGLTFTGTSDQKLLDRAVPNNIPLKILCIGDSITAGYGSSDGNSYRLTFRNLLTSAGASVDFIGTQASGNNNPDNQHEGYGAYRINAIFERIRATSILSQQPNLVLIHAGTNDNSAEIANEPYAASATRLASMVDYILCRDPKAVVLVAMLIQNNYQPAQTADFNKQIPALVSDRFKKGFKIRVVDMGAVTLDDPKDTLHPTDAGYRKMAQKWYNAVAAIPDHWWSVSDPASYRGNVEKCAQGKTSFTPALGGNLIAAGAHLASDSPEPPSVPGSTFSPMWGDRGTVAIGAGRGSAGVRFADLDGDGRADYLWVNPDTAAVHAWINGGGNAWYPVNNGDAIAWGTGGRDFVDFADLNGDKRSEYIVTVNGKFKVWRNDGRNGEIWLWGLWDRAADQLNSIFGGGNVPFHVFGDMNGDGKDDLCVINGNGVLDFYIQQGELGTDSFSWKPCLNAGIYTGVRMELVDIDGDGRDDYMSIDDDGGVKGWLNKPGGSCGISWVPINGGGPKTVALISAPPSSVRLADFDGDGKADYMIVENDSGAVRLRPNEGTNVPAASSGIGGYGAALRLADLDGDGVDDYISVSAKTEVLAYLNRGQAVSNWNWAVQNQGNAIAAGDGGSKRYQIHFADIDGDGRDDYLVVDDASGGVKCYLNGGPSGTSWLWNPKGIVALGAGKAGAGVRFADMDGDGRADYIWMDENGAATVWLNGGLGVWQVLNGGAVAAIGVGAKRLDVRFADIDGDGRDDYLWVHPEDGRVDVWYNNGLSGNSIMWVGGGTIATGVGTKGQNIIFARIGTSGRADYVDVKEDTGAFRVWLSGCSEVIGAGGSNTGICPAAPLPAKPNPEPPQDILVPHGSGCITSPCTPCRGSACKNCVGSDCTGCSGPGCAGCDGDGDDCSICTGSGCDGCSGGDCSICRGADCLAVLLGGIGAGGCVGMCVPPGTGPGGGGEPGNPTTPTPTTCSTTTTSSKCAVSCTVTASGTSSGTSCRTATCLTTSGCNLPTQSGFTTTLTSTVCPAKPTWTNWYTDDNQLAPTLGDGEYGGLLTTKTATGIIIATKTITVTSTITETLPFNTPTGEVDIGAISWVQPNRNGGWTQTLYMANYRSPGVVETVCSGGYWDSNGKGTPTPSAWDAIPQTVSFGSAISDAPTPLSSCSYRNPAAPSTGDGGTLACAGTTMVCYAYSTRNYIGCNTDVLAGYLTTIVPLLHCPAYSPSSIVITRTTAIVATTTSTVT